MKFKLLPVEKIYNAVNVDPGGQFGQTNLPAKGLSHKGGQHVFLELVLPFPELQSPCVFLRSILHIASTKSTVSG